MTTAEVEPNRFAEGLATAALHQAAAWAGFDVGGARLLRLGENAVFEAGDLVVRVGRRGSDLAAARRTIQVSRWLNVEHLPAVEAIDVDQPVVVRGMPVTFWRSLGDAEAYGDTAQLARLLRRLHDLTPPAGLLLPTAKPWRRAARRLAKAKLTDADRAFLTQRLDALREQYDLLSFALPAGVIHDDANVGNVLIDGDNIARLIDLDGITYGPREWDLILTAIYYDRYGWHTREEYENFVHIYGFDVMQWSGYQIFADLRELIMVTWMSQNIDDKKVATEFDKRMNALRGNGSRRDWCPF